ncbi:hypothetical protein [Natronorubrum halophilum]|uniref:hypothetical protein n=1 Tax=Natronorubrum halophilum TaxID=1702106 RepID=UPI000EF6A6B5|nr:hypothetical protein [Natronorubrum halophilum]
MISSVLVPLQTSGEEFAVDPIVMIGGMLIGILIAVGIAYWVYKDASKRENNEVLWAIGTGGLLFLFFPAGIVAVVAYFIIRSDETPTEPVQDESTAGDW